MLFLLATQKNIQLTNYKTGLDYAKTQDQKDSLAKYPKQLHIQK